MKDTKFTPGPWKLHNRAHCGVMSESGRLVANTGIHTSNVDPEAVDAENLANAKLISAAPELYKMLEQIVDWWNQDDINENPLTVFEKFHEAKQALAKARGEEINQPQG